MSGRGKDDSMGTESNGADELVRLFTDGACSGNPGPGGWAFILQHPATGQVKDFAVPSRRRPTIVWS